MADRTEGKVMERWKTETKMKERGQFFTLLPWPFVNDVDVNFICASSKNKAVPEKADRVERYKMDGIKQLI